MTSQTHGPRNLRSICTAVIGWSLVATGAGHATFVAVGQATTAPVDERAVRALMAATTVPVAGMERSYWDLFQGFSLMMALMLVGLGLLVLLLRRAALGLVHETRTFLALLGLVLVPAQLLSVLLLPPPPIAVLGLALAAVALGLRQPNTHPVKDHTSSSSSAVASNLAPG